VTTCLVTLLLESNYLKPGFSEKPGFFMLATWVYVDNPGFSNIVRTLTATDDGGLLMDDESGK